MCPIFGFDSLDDLYGQMSALGDIPMYENNENRPPPYHQCNNENISFAETMADNDDITSVGLDGGNENEYHDTNQPLNRNPSHMAKIQSISIPHCVVHALDDPIVSWEGTARNDGWMHPSNLVLNHNADEFTANPLGTTTSATTTSTMTSKSIIGSSYLMILLTKTGGHVGWPIGGFSFWKYKWKWMSDAIISFAHAIEANKKRRQQQQK